MFHFFYDYNIKEINLTIHFYLICELKPIVETVS